MSKEATYDERISPLMTQIIKTCKEHKIAMVAQFALPSEADVDLCCTTALTTAEYTPPRHMVQAVSLLKRGGPPPLNMRIDCADGTTTLATIL